MRTLTRNKRGFYYCLLIESGAPVVDENGNRTGETVPVYADAVHMMANISPASGFAQTEQFGNLTDYDHVIVTDWMDCPITESTVLFLEKEPEYRTESIPIDPQVRSLPSGSPTYQDARIPLYDYIVRKVSPSMHSISIAVRKAEVR